MNNQLVKDAVLYNFAIMGEASNNIKVVDATFLEQYTDLKKVLSLAYRMRNVVIHAYLDVDYLLIWDTVKYKLPELKNLLAKVENKRTMQFMIRSLLYSQNSIGLFIKKLKNTFRK